MAYPAHMDPQLQVNAQANVPKPGQFNGNPNTVHNTKPLEIPNPMNKPLGIPNPTKPVGAGGIGAPPLPPGSGTYMPTNPPRPNGMPDPAPWHQARYGGLPGNENRLPPSYYSGGNQYQSQLNSWQNRNRPPQANFISRGGMGWDGGQSGRQPGDVNMGEYLGLAGWNPEYVDIRQTENSGGNPLYPNQNGQQQGQGQGQNDMIQQLMRMLQSGGGGGLFSQFRPGYQNQQGYGYSNDSYGSQPWMGGQNANLGRYAPPMFNMSGQSINQGQGGYAYNLPNNYGPYPQFSQFGMGPQFGNNARPWMPPGGG